MEPSIGCSEEQTGSSSPRSQAGIFPGLTTQYPLPEEARNWSWHVLQADNKLCHWAEVFLSLFLPTSSTEVTDLGTSVLLWQPKYSICHWFLTFPDTSNQGVWELAMMLVHIQTSLTASSWGSCLPPDPPTASVTGTYLIQHTSQAILQVKDKYYDLKYCWHCFLI